MANGGDIIYHFKGDTSDLDGKTKNTKSLFGDMTKSMVVANVATQALNTSFKVMTKFIDESVQAYADLEQSIGGAKLLFGDSFDFIEERSKQAYKSAGLSANEYLQQVNGFAVGLKESMGGNEKAAAELADKIITAEADIVAATGNTQEAVQNAFNGIMKGNYVMLDNLQLGIKPTKEGMQEVIDKVNEWNATQGHATQYQMGNLADMQSALVDYVEMQKLSGYASMEADKTITGSIKAVRSAFQNFLSGAGGIEQVIETLVTAGTNIGKAIVKMAPQIIEGIVKLIEAIIPMLPDLIKQVLPSLLKGMVELTSGLLRALPDIVIAIADMLPTLIPMIIDAILEIIPALIENLPLFIEAGIQLIIGGLAKGLIQAIPVLISNIPKIVSALINGLKGAVSKIADIGVNMIKGLWNGIGKMKDWVVNKVKDLGKSILKGLKGILGIHSPSTEFAIIGRYSILGYTEALDSMKQDVEDTVASTFGLSPQLTGSAGLNYSPSVIVNNEVNMTTDPLGQVVSNIKTFSGGAKNDYNYGMGV